MRENIICRAMLTALHQNHNANRKQKFNADGTERISIQRKKSTNLTPTAYWTKEKADYGNFYVISEDLPKRWSSRAVNRFLSKWL